MTYRKVLNRLTEEYKGDLPKSKNVIKGIVFKIQRELKKMKNDAAATKEMMEVNERYDRQIIRLSGFEW